jgi:hypothetical protein
MPARIQGYALGLGMNKQADISTIATTFNRWRKLDLDIPTLVYGTETDKDEIGKGHEFISQVFPTAYDVPGRINKYGSAEFVAWAWAYALGDVAYATSLYTIKPIDPATTLELPYWSMVAQLGEGGGSAIDEAYLGLAIEDVVTNFKYGPGRASILTDVTFVGSGRHTIPSAVTLPATLSENYMLSSSAAVSINGIDYVAGSPGAKTILNGSMGWKNNLILPMRYFPGSGLVDNAAVGGRILIGNRVPTLTFTAFLQHDSLEYTKLIAQTTGTAVITFTFDATHFVTWTYHSVSFEMVTRTQEDGIVAVTVTCAPKYDPTGGPPVNGVLTVTSKNALTAIAQ